MPTKLTYSKVKAGGFDLSSNSTVSSMEVTGVIPDGCSIRTLFSVDNGSTWNKLVNNGGVATLTASATQAITATSVLSEGNTPSELSAVTSCPEMAGKVVYIAIAIQSAGNSLPTFGISIDGAVGLSVYSKTLESTEIKLEESSTIYDYNLNAAATNGGTVTVTASLYQTNDGSTYAWSDYMSLESMKGKVCTKIKLKAVYNALTIGASSAAINHLYVYVRPETAILTGQNADVISVTQDFATDMMYCRLLVKHQNLLDAKLKAYVSMTAATKRRDRYVLGTGTGSRQTIQLSDNGIDFSRMLLFANTAAVSDFDYNSIDNTITFIADKDATIFGTYTYGQEAENWQEMVFGSTQKYTSSSNANDLYSSNYTYASEGVSKGVSAIRIGLVKPSGSVTDSDIGTGTGRTQLIYLGHYFRKDSLTFTAGGVTVPQQNWTYDDRERLLSIACTKDAQIKMSGVYVAETPILKGFVAAWNQ